LILFDFFGYVQWVYVIFFYSFFFLGCFLVFRKHRFSFSQSIWFSIISLACLEIFWESLFNWISIYNQQNIIPFYPIYEVILRNIFISFPIFLWFYYNLKLGKPVISLFFILSFGAQLIFIFFFPFQFSALILRIVWIVVLMINVYFWRAPFYLNLHTKKEYYFLFSLMFYYVLFPFLFSVSLPSKSYELGFIIVDYLRFFVPLFSLCYLWRKTV